MTWRGRSDRVHRLDSTIGYCACSYSLLLSIAHCCRSLIQSTHFCITLIILSFVTSSYPTSGVCVLYIPSRSPPINSPYLHWKSLIQSRRGLEVLDGSPQAKVFNLDDKPTKLQPLKKEKNRTFSFRRWRRQGKHT